MYADTGNLRISQLYLDYCKSEEWLAEHYEQIKTAAYYKAEARDFAPGHELEDWLEAETEVAKIAAPHEFFV